MKFCMDFMPLGGTLKATVFKFLCSAIPTRLLLLLLLLLKLSLQVECMKIDTRSTRVRLHAPLALLPKNP
jgi:hypothetical protein